MGPIGPIRPMGFISRSYKSHLAVARDPTARDSCAAFGVIFVREISGSFVVAKAASPEELATTTTTGAGGLEGNEAGGREARRGIR